MDAKDVGLSLRQAALCNANGVAARTLAAGGEAVVAEASFVLR